MFLCAYFIHVQNIEKLMNLASYIFEIEMLASIDNKLYKTITRTTWQTLC